MLLEESSPADEPSSVPSSSASIAAHSAENGQAGSKTWVCTVCKNVHQDTAPPDVCPICGVPKEKFEAEAKDSEGNNVSSENSSIPEAAQTASKGESSKSNGFLTQQILKHHLHPMTVHVPNGVIPIAVLFVFGAVILQAYSLVEAAFYNLVAVLLSMPIVWLSGVVEWKKRYAGVWTSRFVTKIVCGIIVPACALALAIWYRIDPKALEGDSPTIIVILALNLVMLAATSLAGFVGGKFVFKE